MPGRLRTQVGIIGAGPAGLMLSHLLAQAGIESVVLEARTRTEVEETIRAGVLEQGTVDLMRQTGVGEGVDREGARHDGIALRFGGTSHRIDLAGLTGRSVWLYPQHKVLRDLIAARLRAGGDIRFQSAVQSVRDAATDTPVIRFTDATGVEAELACTTVVGCDGSTGATKSAIPSTVRTEYVRTYPYGWFGILVEAPPSSAELVYVRSDRGFALISTRTPTVQRMYFQCDPYERVEDWTDEEIWAELQGRVAGDDFSLQQGRIFQRGVVPMRSYVCSPMQHGRLFLAGDAAHIVPPTGAKGLNLAIADARILARALEVYYASGRRDRLDAYSDTALRRVWRAQHFSWWMTSMMHNSVETTEFDLRRQWGELDLVTSTRAGSAFLAEAYTGWPLEPWGSDPRP